MSLQNLKDRRDYYSKKRSTPEGDAHWRERSRKAYNRRRQAVAAQIRLKLYGIKEQQYQQMVLEQNGLCEICGKSETKTRNGHVRSLCIDHDHKTGKVRNLLCSKCNEALGLVSEDTSILAKMIDYVNAHNTQV